MNTSLAKSFNNNLRLFFDGAFLSYIALFRWLRPMTYLASKVFGPLTYMLFFVFLGKYATGEGNTSFYVIGNAVQMVAFSGIFGVTMSISGDRWDGTLPYLFGTPANRLALFFGRAFMHVIDGAFGTVLAFGWGVLLMDLDLSHLVEGEGAKPIMAIATRPVCLMGQTSILSLVTRNV